MPCGLFGRYLAQAPPAEKNPYKRHGTTTLFAAFNLLNGKVIGSCWPRHRGKQFIAFLNQLEKPRNPRFI
jgi:hypothetical protein